VSRFEELDELLVRGRRQSVENTLAGDRRHNGIVARVEQQRRRTHLPNTAMVLAIADRGMFSRLSRASKSVTPAAR
jgi:hypothetical protein